MQDFDPLLPETFDVLARLPTSVLAGEVVPTRCPEIGDEGAFALVRCCRTLVAQPRVCFIDGEARGRPMVTDERRSGRGRA